MLVFLPFASSAQNQEMRVLTRNVIFGGFTSGVGSVINKDKNENWKRFFVRGFWQGSIGGVLNYSAKKTIGLIDKNDNLVYALPARIVSSAGNSIIQNASLNEPFLQNWHLEYAFIRVDFSTKSRADFRLRILPASIISTSIAATDGRIDLGTSLLSGVLAFRSRDLINTPTGMHDGVNYGRAFVYMEHPLKHHILSHEIIHEYQYREHLVFNTYFKKTVAKQKDTRFKKIVSKYIYPDIPYFGLFYMLPGIDKAHLFRNYYEFEAERFATNRHVNIY